MATNYWSVDLDHKLSDIHPARCLAGTDFEHALPAGDIHKAAGQIQCRLAANAGLAYFGRLNGHHDAVGLLPVIAHAAISPFEDKRLSLTKEMPQRADS